MQYNFDTWCDSSNVNQNPTGYFQQPMATNLSGLNPTATQNTFDTVHTNRAPFLNSALADVFKKSKEEQQHIYGGQKIQPPTMNDYARAFAGHSTLTYAKNYAHFQNGLSYKQHQYRTDNLEHSIALRALNMPNRIDIRQNLHEFWIETHEKKEPYRKPYVAFDSTNYINGKPAPTKQNTTERLDPFGWTDNFPPYRKQKNRIFRRQAKKQRHKKLLPLHWNNLEQNYIFAILARQSVATELLGKIMPLLHNLFDTHTFGVDNSLYLKTLCLESYNYLLTSLDQIEEFTLPVAQRETSQNEIREKYIALQNLWPVESTADELLHHRLRDTKHDVTKTQVKTGEDTFRQVLQKRARINPEYVSSPKWQQLSDTERKMIVQNRKRKREADESHYPNKLVQPHQG